jgi:hypothetical protein
MEVCKQHGPLQNQINKNRENIVTNKVAIASISAQLKIIIALGLFNGVGVMVALVRIFMSL